MHQTKSTYYRENELKHTDHHEENGLENRQHIENSQTLVQFGAGNIGRSFIGQLFSRAGFEVVFIDIDETLVNQLNAAGGYSVVVKEPAGDTTIYVDHVRAINGRDVEAAAQAVKEAAYIATSVGSGALPHIFPVLAEGLMRRDGPVDIIIAENIRHGASVFRSGLARYLPSSSSLDTQVGFVETSIGKMVPMMTEEDISSDPLQVFAEAYNTLIVDRNGFIGPIPPLSGMQAVSPIDAYVDRKFFVHNLGHAASAYLGYAAHPETAYIWEILEDSRIRDTVRKVMQEGGQAVLKTYPETYTRKDMQDHIDDLISRFRNPALKDTVFRVGRDLQRKLSRDDRIVGAMLLAAEHGLPFTHIAEVYAAALQFDARDTSGCRLPRDDEFRRILAEKGSAHMIENISGLDNDDENTRSAVRQVRAALLNTIHQK